MSLRSMRRSMIAASAALAVGGLLSGAASASAASIPLGHPTDATNSSLYGLLNDSYNGLKKGDQLLAGLGDTAVPAPTAFPAEPALTATQAQQIAADFTDTTINGTAPSKTTYANELKLSDPTYAGDSQSIDAAGVNWSTLTGLVAVDTVDPTDFPGGLFTVDGDVSMSSAATVTGVGKPTAYSTTFGVSGAAQEGFVVPSSFTVTFPDDFGVNLQLASDEIQQSQVANPPASSAIGTASVSSPAFTALVPGSKGVDSGAEVFVVATQNLTQPEFELYLGQGNYILGRLNGMSIPLSIIFGEPVIGGITTALPVSSVSLNFPAATSPLEARSCTNLGELTGTMTDAVSPLASTYFGDSTDSGALAMAATPTKVADECSPKAAASIGGIKQGKPAVRIHLTGNGGTRFTSETITLPSGLSAKGLKAKDLKVTGARLKSVSGKGRTLVVTFRSATRSATVSFNKGLAVTGKLKTAVIKRRTRSLALKYTVKYAPAGARAASSTVATVTVKKLS